MQGISSNWPIFAKICPENICEFSSFRGKSLRDGAGNQFARAGNRFRLFDRSREFGVKSIRAPTYPIASKSIFVEDKKIINAGAEG
jgi:hypothetical protein